MLRFASVFAACLTIFFVAVHAITNWRQGNDNRNRLNEITEQVISRVEYATDYSLLTAYDFVNESDLSCDAAAIAKMQQLALARSIIKNIQVYDDRGTLKCQAFSNSGSDSVAALLPGAVARNPTISLHNIQFYDRKMLGVALRGSDDGRVLIVSDFEALLYDTMPAALRDQSFVSLSISGFTEFSSIGDNATLSSGATTIEKTAQRFPLTAHFKIDQAALSKWNKPSLLYNILIALGLATLASIIFIREIQRPLSPSQRFREALHASEFQPFFQPVVNAQDGTVEGCEALLRWVKANGEIIPPMKFINELENSPLIEKVTLQIIEKSLFVLAPILRARPSFHLAFNITPEHIVAPHFLDDLNRICVRHNVKPSSVTVELTERQGSTNDEAIRKATQIVRVAGYKIALDDVGTGHNGLAQVHDFEADYLKIDKKFVDMLGQSETASSIVSLLVELGQKMKLTLIAEGIETESQAALLRKIGVHKLQGYFYSKPLPAADFIVYCQTNLLQATATELKMAVEKTEPTQVGLSASA